MSAPTSAIHELRGAAEKLAAAAACFERAADALGDDHLRAGAQLGAVEVQHAARRAERLLAHLRVSA